MSDDEIDVRVRLKETGKFHAESKKVERDVDRMGESVKRSGDEADKSSDKHKKLSGELNILRRITGLIKPAALITGLGLAAQAASALAAGGVAAASALAPLAGLMVAYPALASAFGQGLGVVKLAMAGVTQAVGGLNKEMDPTKLAALTPPAQKFAKALDSMKKPVIALQESAQRGLFPGLTKALGIVRPALRQLRGEVGLTGRVLGGVAVRGARLVGSKGFMGDLQAQARSNARWLGQLGGAGINLTSALMNILRAADPLVSWMVRLAVQGSRIVKVWAAQGRQSRKLAQFFGETRRVATILGKTLGSLAGGLINVGKAAYPLGLSILRVFQQQAKAFKDWSGSFKGRNALAEFFRKARAPLWEAGRLIRDVGKAFFSLSQGNMVAPLIRQVRTQLLPVFVSMVNSTTKAFGPHLIAMLTQTLKLFATLAGSSGPLVIFVDLLTAGARALNWMNDNIPGFKTMLVTLIGALGVLKAMSWAKAITGVTGLASAFRGLSGAAAGAAAASEAAGGAGGGAPLPWMRNRARAGKLAGAGAGLSAAAGPAGIAVAVALGVREGIKASGFKPAAGPDLLSGDFAKNIAFNVHQLAPGLPKVKFGGPLGLVPQGVEKGSGRPHLPGGAILTRTVSAKLDPKSLTTTNRSLRLWALRQGALTSRSLAQGLSHTKGRLPKSFQRQIFNQLDRLPAGARKRAELTMIGFTKQMEKSGALPKGTTRRLISFMEKQWGKLPGSVGTKAEQAARRANLAISSIHRAVVTQIPGIGPLIKANLVGPLESANQAAKDTNNSLLNLPDSPSTPSTPAKSPHGGPTSSPYLAPSAHASALAPPHTPSPVATASGDGMGLEVIAPIHVQVGNDSVYKSVTKASARVRRKKSRRNG